jgi:hypothetical protein
LVPLRPLPYREVKRKLESVGFSELAREEVTSNSSNRLMKVCLLQLCLITGKLQLALYEAYCARLDSLLMSSKVYNGSSP